MALASALPHMNAALNVGVLALLAAAYVAIRTNRRTAHRRLMTAAVVFGFGFALLYGLQWALVPHIRFPGDDWVRTMFVTVLGTHELMALVAVPLIWRTVRLARSGRFDAHRLVVRYTYPVWLYVTVTGVMIYVLRHYVRPG